MEQSIIGYHQDPEHYWVAELACGHFQHVRHDPPMTTRPWVLTKTGRTSMLGYKLQCKKCDIGAPKDQINSWRSTPMETVTKEIEALHEFFVAWFTGAIDASQFKIGFLNRFDPTFLLIPPAGTILDLDGIAANIRAGYASNPNFRIAIRNVQVRRVFDGHILATYEEWQRNAIASTPPDNARLATVLFADTPPLRWLHIHETWMPKDVAAAGPYDF